MIDTKRTFHDRIGAHPALGAMAGLWSSGKNFIYAETLDGRPWIGDLAVSHYADFGLSAKQWEHCRRELKGQIKSQDECGKLEIEKLERRIAAKEQTIADALKRFKKAKATVAKQEKLRDRDAEREAAGRKPLKVRFDVVAHDGAKRIVERTPFALHQHKRKLSSLKDDLVAAEKPRTLCFGGRKLFAAQHHLAENGYADRAEWLADWKGRRSSQFFVEGDAGKGSGNQFVRIFPDLYGFAIELRLPERLKHLADRHEKINGTVVHVVRFCGLRFEHGRTSIYEALRRGLPISWRFRRDEKGQWYVYASIKERHAEQQVVGGSRWSCGALGVDLNAGHVAATLVDRFGNPVRTWNFPLLCYGKTEGQRQDAVRKAAAAVVALAREHRVPIVSEDLDFSAKKAALRDSHGPWYARMLSSFAYGAFDDALRSACVRSFIHLRRVNPAFTSVIGDLGYAKRYGLSVHAAAAAVVARRAMNLSERLPAPLLLERRRFGDRVTLSRPVWNGDGHVWSAWRKVAKERRAALAGPAGPWPTRPRPSQASRSAPRSGDGAGSGGGTSSVRRGGGSPPEAEARPRGRTAVPVGPRLGPASEVV